MELKEILGVISVIIALCISLSYIYTIVRGKTRPHLYSVAMDALISTIVFAGAFTAGAGAGVWSLGVATVLVYVMVILCFKYGTKDVKPIDGIFALLALLSVIPWILTKDPTLSVVLASLINLFSFIPAYRKTWNDPYSEPATIWGANALKHVVSLPATSVFSVATVFYSASIILLNIVFVTMILLRRKKKTPLN